MSFSFSLVFGVSLSLSLSLPLSMSMSMASCPSPSSVSSSVFASFLFAFSLGVGLLASCCWALFGLLCVSAGSSAGAGDDVGGGTFVFVVGGSGWVTFSSCVCSDVVEVGVWLVRVSFWFLSLGWFSSSSWLMVLLLLVEMVGLGWFWWLGVLLFW